MNRNKQKSLERRKSGSSEPILSRGEVYVQPRSRDRDGATGNAKPCGGAKIRKRIAAAAGSPSSAYRFRLLSGSTNGQRRYRNIALLHAGGDETGRRPEAGRRIPGVGDDHGVNACGSVVRSVRNGRGSGAQLPGRCPA